VLRLHPRRLLPQFLEMTLLPGVNIKLSNDNDHTRLFSCFPDLTHPLTPIINALFDLSLKSFGSRLVKSLFFQRVRQIALLDPMPGE
jgi:hypothetical protein